MYKLLVPLVAAVAFAGACTSEEEKAADRRHREKVACLEGGGEWDAFAYAGHGDCRNR